MKFLSTTLAVTAFCLTTALGANEGGTANPMMGPRLNMNDIQTAHTEKAETSLQDLRQKGRVLERSLDKGLAAVRRGGLDDANVSKISQAGRDYERSYDRTLSRCAYAGVIVPNELVALRPIGMVGNDRLQAERLVAAHLARTTREAAKKIRFGVLPTVD